MLRHETPNAVSAAGAPPPRPPRPWAVSNVGSASSSTAPATRRAERFTGVYRKGRKQRQASPTLRLQSPRFRSFPLLPRGRASINLTSADDSERRIRRVTRVVPHRRLDGDPTRRVPPASRGWPFQYVAAECGESFHLIIASRILSMHWSDPKPGSTETHGNMGNRRNNTKTSFIVAVEVSLLFPLFP